MPRRATRTSFKPGNPGGPGKPRLTEEQKEIRKLTKTKMQGILDRFCWMNRDELKDLVSNKDTPLVEVAVARLFAAAMTDGDTTRLNFLFERLVGKVKDEVSVDLQEGRHPALARIPSAILKKYAPRPTEPEE